MTALIFTLTNAGRARLIDASAGGTSAVRITAAGITDRAFVVSPTLTALPGELKRVATVAGVAIDDTTVHLTIRDDTADAYDARGIALYLDDGTLFAVYGQPDPIFGKSPVSSFYLAADLKFLPGQAAQVQFGATSFLLPPASATTMGVSYLATIAEALAGAVADRIITPATLSRVLDNYVAADQMGVPQGVATLGPDGKLAVAQRPPIDLIDVFPVNGEPAMLALAATPGDFAVRSDNGRVYVLQQTPANVIGNWLEISTPAPVTMVNGKVGNIALNAGDVGAASIGRRVTGAGLLAGQGGDLSADRAFTLLPATPAEAVTQPATNDRVLTPASLTQLIAMIAGKAAGGATVTGEGLLSGGGALADNPVLRVLAASAAEVLAGAIDTKAITPAALGGLPKSLTPNGYYYFPGGLILQWIQYRGYVSGEPAIYVPYPTSFPSQCFGGVTSAYIAAPSPSRDLWTQLVAPGLGGCQIQFQADDANDRRADGFDLWLLGC